MQKYIVKYKPFLLFLAKFFLVYIILSALYQIWLSGYDPLTKSIDPFTVSVAHQSENLLEFFGATAATEPHPSQPCIKLLYNGKYVARIIEGCNAISVMILFISFIVAFAGNWKPTILFSIIGCILIHLMNIARIAILSAAIYALPEHEHFLHGVIFPLLIYGFVFILWVIWVNKYSFYAGSAKK